MSMNDRRLSERERILDRDVAGMEVAGMTADLIDRLPGLEREAQELERKARALRQIIEGVRALNGDAAAFLAPADETSQRANQYEPADGPRGREAVRRIISERTGTWRVIQVKDEIARRGWPTSRTGIEKAIKRMADDGEIVRVRQGVYKSAPVVDGSGVHVPEQGVFDP